MNITQVFTKDIVFYALFVFALTLLVRRIVEFAWKNAKSSHLWDFLLEIIPMIMGGLIAIIFSIVPDPFGHNSAIGRLAFGLIAGLFSSKVYRAAKLLWPNSAKEDPTDPTAGV